jgi:secreted trypsin-like serine protease
VLRRVPIVVLGALLAAAVLAAQAGAIAGGHPASRPYPHQALIELQRSGGSAFCGGNLVASRWVVTAGHCVTNSDGTVLPTAQLRVALGETRRSLMSADRFFDVTRVIRHERYDDGLATNGAPDYDVALLALSRPASQPSIPLASTDRRALWAPGQRGTVIGWGMDGYGNYPDELHEAQMPIHADADCARIFAPLAPSGGRNPYSAATMVCAGGPEGGATCSGDSGGPLLAADGSQMVLVGITSWGFQQCNDVRYANVFAKVGEGELAAWLRERMPYAGFAMSAEETDPGQPVTFTSTSRHPDGSFNRLEWDLDGDGAFDDGAGATASQSFGSSGRYTIGLRAANDHGDVETARRDVVVRPPTAVTLDAAGDRVRIREGDRTPVTLRVTRAGRGFGRVGLAVDGTAAAGRDYAGTLPASVAFAEPVGVSTFELRPVDDNADESAETARLALERPEGGLVVGEPAGLTVTILDDDLSMRVVRWRAKRDTVPVRVRVRASGRLTARAMQGSSRALLGTATRTARRAGTVTLRLRLTRAGRRSLAGGRRLRGVRIVVDYTGDGGPRQGVRRGTLRR